MLALSLGVSAQTFSFGTKANPKGETIEVDRQGFIINGKRQIPVMGEMHYARVPQSDWRREIRKMKAGGVTILSTYCFWIHHEENQGEWNWTGNRSLNRFLQVCKEENMPVVLRVGPFCHGEVYQGGFPVWLVKKAQENPKEYKLRSLAPGFMEATRRLYRNIFLQAEDMLWKNGGTVIGLQIENECRGPWTYYMALKKMAVEAGFDLPFYTRTGWPKLNGKETFGEMLPLYGDYADGFWDRTLNDMPGEYPAAFIMKDTRLSAVIATEALGTNQSTKMEQSDKVYPYLTCELGGGMMPSYHRRINISGHEAFPMAICKLGSGSNLPGYYMYHGGTNPYNPKHTMAETQQSDVTNYNDMPLMSYDFQCPLGEMGQPNLHAFHETRLLHQFLADWGEQLSVMPVDTLSEHYARRGCFEFYNDYVRIKHEEGRAWVRPVGMPWRGSKVTATAQPYCHLGDTLVFVPIKGMKPKVKVSGKKVPWRVLSADEARRAYKIHDRLYFAHHDGGILYSDASGRIMEEYWLKERDVTSLLTMIRKAGSPRKVAIGRQKVAAMPVDSDYLNAQVYKIDMQKIAVEVDLQMPSVETDLQMHSAEADKQKMADSLFLEVNYAGDCARVYADGKLVADNFWNGKAMLVRLSDLVGKDVELRILPLAKDAPIYLQKEQRQMLEAAPSGSLLELQSVAVIHCATEVYN